MEFLNVVQALLTGRHPPATPGFRPARLCRLLASGFGPLIVAAYGVRVPAGMSSDSWDHLIGTDLAARVITGESLDALETILERCARRGIPEPVLLKGMSTALQCYPEPHLRPMRDMDLLLPSEWTRPFEAVLKELGYRQVSDLPAAFYERIHHSMPFHRRETGIWIEVHRGLFPPDSPLAGVQSFQPEILFERAMKTTFRGHQAYRLDDLTQVAYTSAHWLQGFNPRGGGFPLLDLAFLLHSRSQPLDWGTLLERFDETEAAVAMRVALGFLQRFGLAAVPEDVLASLTARAGRPKGPAYYILLGLARRWMFEKTAVTGLPMDNSVGVAWETLTNAKDSLGGLHKLPWHIIFPPRRPDRFDPRFQLGRLGSLVGRSRR